MTRVVVVDDQHLVRAGFVAMVAALDGFDVVGEASTGHDAIETIVQLHPDVVLLDLRLPDLSGVEVLRRLRAKTPDVKVVIITAADDETSAADSIRAGADAYLLKTASLDQVEAAMHDVTSGRIVPPPSGLRDAAGLSPRELEVLRLLAVGHSNKQIASRLVLGIETVKSHVSAVLHKLGAADRAEAVAIAFRRGLVE